MPPNTAGGCWGGSRRRRGGTHCKKMRGGMYGFGGALNGTGAGPQWDNMGNPEVNPATGGEVPESILGGQGGGRRRRGRTGKKGTRKGKKSRRVTRRRRAMRGGNTPLYHGSANSRVEWHGDGAGGLPTFQSGAANVPGVGSGHTQVAGTWNA
jgi:hypothetical protein